MNLPQEGTVPDPRKPKPSNSLVKPITMSTIAKAADVSQGAISSLLNDRDYGIRVSEKTRERVFKVCRELGYIPNDLRAFVRMYPEHGDTCLLVSSKIAGGLSHPSVGLFASAALASTRNLAIALYDEGRDYGTSSENLPPPLANGTASKFIVLGASNASLFKAIQRREHPLILVGQPALGPGTTGVLPDYAAAAHLALAQFIQHGHCRVAIVGGPFGDARLALLNHAISHASQEFGLPMDAHNILQSDLSFAAGVAALDTLLARSPAPTAIFCLSEAAACGVAAQALAKGIAVPKKLSIVALADHTGTPPAVFALTTVVVPIEEIVVAAVKEADRQVRGALPAEGYRITIGAKLCARESCGPVQK